MHFETVFACEIHSTVGLIANLNTQAFYVNGSSACLISTIANLFGKSSYDYISLS